MEQITVARVSLMPLLLSFAFVIIKEFLGSQNNVDYPRSGLKSLAWETDTYRHIAMIQHHNPDKIAEVKAELQKNTFVFGF
ncbi:MAG: hypothetical protein OXC82_03550 [Rhodobacteraceae bacterium]|nr:hypothetical protein [Paracoccaceae bacterium]MCY4249498.1 hypothetical protein [Paracoccaceae bacterium]